jgi:hypothetical protein
LNYIEEELKMDCHVYYGDLINHCQRMVNYGKTEFEQKIIEFAGLLESKGVFEKFGISDNHLKIFIECSIGTKQYEWAEDFIKRNIKHADEANRDSIYNLGLAKIHFFRKEYSISRDYLMKVSFEDYVHYIDAKLIEARIEYEEKCFVEIASIIQTVQKYLKSHTEIGDIYGKSYLAFMDFLIRLVKIYESSLIRKTCDYDIKKLKQGISSYPAQLYGEEWLLEKISEIEKGRL